MAVTYAHAQPARRITTFAGHGLALSSLARVRNRGGRPGKPGGFCWHSLRPGGCGLRPGSVWTIDDYTDVCTRYEQPCLHQKRPHPSSCPVPSREGTLLNAYSDALHGYHYIAVGARIRPGEISVFDISSFGKKHRNST